MKKYWKWSKLHQKGVRFFVEKRRNILRFVENADIISPLTNYTKVLYG